jgi:hypothetical protein
MKENTKIIIGVIIGIVISSTISITATTMIQANSVSYKTSNGDTTDVNSALDRLFDLNSTNEKITELGTKIDQKIGIELLGTISNPSKNTFTNFNVSDLSKYSYFIVRSGINNNSNYDRVVYPNTNFYTYDEIVESKNFANGIRSLLYTADLNSGYYGYILKYVDDITLSFQSISTSDAILQTIYIYGIK